MKKLFALLLCGVLAVGAVGGCGNKQEVEKPQGEQQEQEGQKDETQAVFEFTKNEYVTLVDERMANRERKLLSEYPAETKETTIEGSQQTATIYLMDEKVNLTICEDKKTGKVSNISFFETFNILSGEALDDYTALLINSLIVLEPEMVKDIVNELGLEETEDTTKVTEGANGTYIYTVKDGIAMISAFPK